jgi:hypothetical protein
MIEPRNVPFGELHWINDAPGIRSRETDVDGTGWAIVEYSESTSREKWCEAGHCGYVVSGEIEYDFDDKSAPLRAKEGEAFLLPRAPLAGGVHRGRNRAAGPTRLFLIDEYPNI